MPGWGEDTAAAIKMIHDWMDTAVWMMMMMMMMMAMVLTLML